MQRPLEATIDNFFPDLARAVNTTDGSKDLNKPLSPCYSHHDLRGYGTLQREEEVTRPMSFGKIGCDLQE